MSNYPYKYSKVADPEIVESGGILSMKQKMLVQCVKEVDTFLLDNIRDLLIANGFTDVCLLDEKFIVEAIEEKTARCDNEPLSDQGLSMQIGCPVWLDDTPSCWAIVFMDDALDGMRKEPFLLWMDEENRVHTVCARHYIASGGKIYRSQPRNDHIENSLMEDSACDV